MRWPFQVNRHLGLAGGLDAIQCLSGQTSFAISRIKRAVTKKEGICREQ